MPRGEEELLLQGVCPWEQGNKASLGLGVLLWDCWVPAEPAPEQESPSSHPHPAQVPKDPGGTLQGEQGVTNPHSQALKWHHTQRCKPCSGHFIRFQSLREHRPQHKVLQGSINI